MTPFNNKLQGKINRWGEIFLIFNKTINQVCILSESLFVKNKTVKTVYGRTGETAHTLDFKKYKEKNLRCDDNVVLFFF